MSKALSTRGGVRRRTVERLRRNAQILAERAGGTPLGELAHRYGLSERQVRYICDAEGAPVTQAGAREAEALVHGVLADYQRVAVELEELSRTKAHPTVRLGAVKAKLNLLKDRTQFLTATGLIQQSLGELESQDYQEDAIALANTILDVLDEYAVPLEVHRAILDRVTGEFGHTKAVAEAVASASGEVIE
jgi:hypothetical protein